MSKMYAKEFSDSNIKQAVIGKILFFQEITPNFTFTRIVILLPYQFHGSSMTGILFYNFASCEPLRKNIEMEEKQVW